MTPQQLSLQHTAAPAKMEPVEQVRERAFSDAREEFERHMVQLDANDELDFLAHVLASNDVSAHFKRVAKLLVLEHRIYKRGMVVYGSPGFWHEDEAIEHWADRSDPAAMGDYDAVAGFTDRGSLARKLLGIEPDPEHRGYDPLAVAEITAVPDWPHMTGFIGWPVLLTEENYPPLESDWEMPYTDVKVEKVPAQVTKAEAVCAQ